MTAFPILSPLVLAAVHVFATVYMCGLIWFVQVVHYPLHGLVGPDEFQSYQAAHVQRTSLVVVAPMLVEAVSAAVLTLRAPAVVPAWLLLSGFVLLLVAWLSTAFLSVPTHASLEQGFTDAAHARLVSTNWIRTLAWSGRAVIALMILIFVARSGVTE